MKAKAKVGSLILFATAAALQCAQVQAHDGGAAKHGCDVSMLRGLYLFKGSGFVKPDGSPGIPKAVLGTVRFNGDGTMVVENLTVTVLGLPPMVHLDEGATYTVESNCTGTITVPNGPMWNIIVSSPAFVSQIQTGGPDHGLIQADARLIAR
jgi:hypothetical protein